MGSESNLDGVDQGLPKLMLRTKKSIMNGKNISVKQKGIRMKRSSGTILVADKAVEEQDILSNKMPLRTKRSSSTGLVVDKSVEEQVVGEEERSVVGCGEVVLDCPSSTMIVVMIVMMLVVVVMIVNQQLLFVLFPLSCNILLFRLVGASVALLKFHKK